MSRSACCLRRERERAGGRIDLLRSPRLSPHDRIDVQASAVWPTLLREHLYFILHFLRLCLVTIRCESCSSCEGMPMRSSLSYSRELEYYAKKSMLSRLVHLRILRTTERARGVKVASMQVCTAANQQRGDVQPTGKTKNGRYHGLPEARSSRSYLLTAALVMLRSRTATAGIQPQMPSTVGESLPTPALPYVL